MKFKRIRKIEKLLNSELRKLDESELRKLIGECQRLSNTNCSWIMFGLKKIVIELARMHLRWWKIQRNLAKKSIATPQAGE